MHYLKVCISVFLHLPENSPKLWVDERRCATTVPAHTENYFSKQGYHPRHPQVLSRQCMLLPIMEEQPEKAVQLLTSILPVQHTEDLLLQRHLKNWAIENLH